MNIELVQIQDIPEDPIAQNPPTPEWAVLMHIDQMEVRLGVKDEAAAWDLAKVLRVNVSSAVIKTLILPPLRIYDGELGYDGG